MDETAALCHQRIRLMLEGSDFRTTFLRRGLADFPCRIEGWLNMCDKASLERQRTRWKTQDRSSGNWSPYYCVLLQDVKKLTLYPKEDLSIGDRLLVDLPRVRLDGGRQAFRRRWGYDLAPPPLPEEDEDSDLSETTSLRDERLLRFSSFESTYEKLSDRRGSAPTTPILGVRSSMDSSTSSRFVTFFSKRSFKSTNPLKRTKSVTKLERKRCTLDGDSVAPSRLRTSRSHESLLQTTAGGCVSLDMSQQVVHVTALHSSLLGQEHCFQLTTSQEGTKYYSCRTADERDRWVYSLRRTIQPNQDGIRRIENNLRLWVLEAKGVSPKKKYYCEVWLDQHLYAKTSSRQKSEMCFWGEQFEFNHLTSIEQVVIQIHREADKKKRRDKNMLIGTITIPVASVKVRNLVEKWYPVVLDKGSGMKDTPSIRIKSRYQSIDVLPLVAYQELLQYIQANYLALCEILEPVISIRAKEDMATNLVRIMHKQKMAKQFLADIVMAEIDKIDDSHLTFRGNSLATKATESYMKLLGLKYLSDTLGNFLKTMLDSNDDCEVDPMKVSSAGCLQRQQASLMTFVEMAWVKIINSSTHFPRELQEVFHEYQKRLQLLRKEELGENLISASIFLRFLCPAILSPSLFNLTQEYPQGKAARNLTLVAKTIQTLANFTQFGGKENFMEFMNDFVQREWGSMKAFLRQISSPVVTKEMSRFSETEPYVDLGYQLALLHAILAEWLPRIKGHEETLIPLNKILEDINVLLKESPNLERPEVNLNDKAATLPRSSFIVGSSKKPAADLSTTDDYVLFSALSEEQPNLVSSEECQRKSPPISVSQLSVVSSSGYHTYSPSTSPSSGPPLSFNNPLYNYEPSHEEPCSRDSETSNGSLSPTHKASVTRQPPVTKKRKDHNGNCSSDSRQNSLMEDSESEGVSSGGSIQIDVTKRSPRKPKPRSSKSSYDKTIEQYEEQVSDLKKMMTQLHTKLQEAEQKLNNQETVTEHVVTDWQSRLEDRFRQQQQEKDVQMKNIIKRLITVEEELRKEQQEMQAVIQSKQSIIDAQERKIESLDATNARLLAALRSRDPLKIIENGSTGEVRYKTSSC